MPAPTSEALARPFKAAWGLDRALVVESVGGSELVSRVEWSAISGDEVEAVVSNLMYNWNNRSQRIRPTQGDFGIDVLDRPAHRGVIVSGKR